MLSKHESDPETLGIKGRIHKDIYKEAAQAKKIAAIAALDDAIIAYTKGFEADPRDYYPGVNAINLLIQKGDAQALKEVERLLPLVSFAVARHGGASSSDYWDLATVLELACVGEDWATANRILPKAILAATDSFKTATTIGNLRLLKQAREREARDLTELDGILNELSVRDIELRGEEKLNPAWNNREKFLLLLMKPFGEIGLFSFNGMGVPLQFIDAMATKPNLSLICAWHGIKPPSVPISVVLERALSLPESLTTSTRALG